MFRGPRDYNKLDLKKFTGHKDEVSIAYNELMSLMFNDQQQHIRLLSQKPQT